jgi:hypothetical protein
LMLAEKEKKTLKKQDEKRKTKGNHALNGA